MSDLLVNYLEGLIPVSFAVVQDGKEKRVGENKPEFTVTVNKMPPAKDFLISTSLALGEAYMRGDIEVDKDLYYILNLFLGQMGKFTTNHNKLKKLILTSKTKANQKKEVQSHYDLGNDFYKLWLDETLSYSCAYFKNEDNTLYEAQINKADHILEKLQLKEGMNLLDIGCGWGFLLIRAAKKYHVKGTGITLSQEQFKYFEAKIKEEKLEDYLTVRLMDYRDLPKLKASFDRAVSVGMIEHVGRGKYEEYLRCISEVLKPGGLFLLHYISALREYPGDAWVKKYIFPGGMVPSLREIINIFPEYNFYTLDVESLRRHYNKTLLHWRENFVEHKAEIEKERGTEFARMWELYLCACAATFNNGIIDLHQILMSKGINNELPITRVV
ncbi:SAM-dependent methyltransferase [Konateibacter massiliensis]|uniref:SAM-dependent methyltransferase n=1 Tax=Konateibacter massiliensis TaxID=2002841 RepID=UPI000C155AB2|nr:cyclopropane-fatty-acyl-phospholipid synthase family protein [Konateibacter massiliensis]